ncbi:FecR family protein [Luteimonas aquatica]|uniref:FecR family protein n=1 Tax=Luteimonas aquatica TaxID=450364 RepID=UPI001F5636C3|nr:FecR domain-containing protein [Luteimonas aquatica]
MSEARNIEQTAAAWRARRDEPEWSAQDQAALDTWLEASTAHRVAWLRMEYGWRRIDRLAALRAPAAAPVSRPRPLRWLALAATLGAVTMGVAAILHVVDGAQRYSTGIGGRTSVSLDDGSRLELNTDTQLRAKVGSDARDVWLERGEAYFEVAHDAARPFVVHAGERRVVVLGTRFSVRSDGDRLEVAVVDGRVRVEPPASAPAARTVVATRGEIVLTRADAAVSVAASAARVDNELAWRRGLLVFDDVTLEEAAGEFNRYNRRKLQISGAQAGGTRISGSFNAANVDAFARLLASAYGLRVRDHGERIEISG